MEKKNSNTLSIALCVSALLLGLAFLLFRLGQKSIIDKKWSEYDDYGWS